MGLCGCQAVPRAWRDSPPPSRTPGGPSCRVWGCFCYLVFLAFPGGHRGDQSSGSENCRMVQGLGVQLTPRDHRPDVQGTEHPGLAGWLCGRGQVLGALFPRHGATPGSAEQPFWGPYGVQGLSRGQPHTGPVPRDTLSCEKWFHTQRHSDLRVGTIPLRAKRPPECRRKCWPSHCPALPLQSGRLPPTPTPSALEKDPWRFPTNSSVLSQPWPGFGKSSMLPP